MQLHDTVSRLRAPLVSAGYGNQARDWSAAVSADFLVHWSTKTTTEVVGDEPKAVTRTKIFGGADLALEATDRIQFEGETFEVDGRVMNSYRFGQLHHVRAMLRRVATGG